MPVRGFHQHFPRYGGLVQHDGPRESCNDTLLGPLDDGILAAASPEERGGGGDDPWKDGFDKGWAAHRATVEAIEQQFGSATPAAPSEPAPLDVERLAASIQAVRDYDDDYDAADEAAEIAAEYARLQSTPTPTEEPT